MKKEDLEVLAEKLGLCMCGNIESSLEYICGSLSLVDDIRNKVWENKMTVDEWTDKKDKFFGSEGAAYFMWYYLDNNGLTMHGSSVPGWLTDDGEYLLSYLREKL